MLNTSAQLNYNFFVVLAEIFLTQKIFVSIEMGGVFRGYTDWLNKREHETYFRAIKVYTSAQLGNFHDLHVQ